MNKEIVNLRPAEHLAFKGNLRLIARYSVGIIERRTVLVFNFEPCQNKISRMLFVTTGECDDAPPLINERDRLVPITEMSRKVKSENGNVV